MTLFFELELSRRAKATFERPSRLLCRSAECVVASLTPSSWMLSLGVAAFIAWRLYLRTARLFRRQPLSPRRSWTVLGLFSPIVIFLVLGSLANPGRALALVAGIAVGAALGNYGLRLTKFEQTPSGLFYTPNAHLGVGLSLLFVGRLTYRAVQLYSSGGSADWSQFAGTPLTPLIFGMLAAYYIAYAIGLLRWRSRVGLP